MCGVGDELADVERVGGCETASLEVGGLVWTRATSFVCSSVQGEIAGGVFCKEMDEFSSFSSF